VNTPQIENEGDSDQFDAIADNLVLHVCEQYSGVRGRAVQSWARGTGSRVDMAI